MLNRNKYFYIPIRYYARHLKSFKFQFDEFEKYTQDIAVNDMKEIVKQTLKNYQHDILVKVDPEDEYVDKVDKILLDINECVKNTFTPDEPPIVARDFKTNFVERFFRRIGESQKMLPDKIQILNSAMMALRKLEEYFRNKGRGDIADELYKCYMRYQRERHRLNAATEGFGIKKLKLNIGEIWWWLSDLFSEFSLSVGKILWSSLAIISFFWISFGLSCSVNSQLKNDEAMLKVKFSDCSSIKYKLADNDSINFELNCVEPINIQLITNDKKANFSECFYYSFVTFLNIGSEVYYPANWCGRFFECWEAIMGWVMLGMLLAFFTKRIK